MRTAMSMHLRNNNDHARHRGESAFWRFRSHSRIVSRKTRSSCRDVLAGPHRGATASRWQLPRSCTSRVAAVEWTRTQAEKGTDGFRFVEMLLRVGHHLEQSPAQIVELSDLSIS